VGGAFRHLDKEMAGAITMKQYDLSSAELLESFKEWADENFGSVKEAFKSMVPDGIGLLSFSELRKATRKLKWMGDVRLLYDCLNCGGPKDSTGRSSLSLKDVSWLDCWATNVQADEKEVEAQIWAEQIGKPSKHKPKQVKKTTSMPRLGSAASDPGSASKPGVEAFPSADRSAASPASQFRGGPQQRKDLHFMDKLQHSVGMLGPEPSYVLAGGRPKAMQVAKIYHCASAPRLQAPLAGQRMVPKQVNWLDRSLVTVPM